MGWQKTMEEEWKISHVWSEDPRRESLRPITWPRVAKICNKPNKTSPRQNLKDISVIFNKPDPIWSFDSLQANVA